jgi:uncharacterized protein (TIGR00369 family)
MRSSKNDQQFISSLAELFDEQIPFNKVLGIKVGSMSSESVSVSFQMRDELLGNYSRRMLHGGVISSVIDVTGGLSALMSIQENTGSKNLRARMQTVDWLTTLDLRVDFLRPAKGEHFVVKAHPLRTGKRITVIRTELRNDEDNLVAVGTGTYITRE